MTVIRRRVIVIPTNVAIFALEAIVSALFSLANDDSGEANIRSRVVLVVICFTPDTFQLDVIGFRLLKLEALHIKQSFVLLDINPVLSLLLHTPASGGAYDKMYSIECRLPPSSLADAAAVAATLSASMLASWIGGRNGP